MIWKRGSFVGRAVRSRRSASSQSACASMKLMPCLIALAADFAVELEPH
jgi:hypothetical protein